ncbi:MAG: PAS domain-containing protein [Chloroflexi bacterium]|jgi:two-component system sensor histidine kinase UhpB|nr:PAS domain-containing protein [Chloroflexota bacterium]
MTSDVLSPGETDVARAFHQSIIDGIVDPIMVIDTDYNIILMNRAAQAFASAGKTQSLPLFCYQLSHHLDVPCDGEAHPCPLMQVRELGRPVTVVHEHCQVDGETRMVEVNAAPLLGSDGSFQGIIESMRDVTECHHAQEALRRNRDRLRALTAQLAEVSEGERQRLSRELHDQVGQNLTALGINLNIIRAEIILAGSAPLISRLDDSLSLVEQTTERIRDVMADLRPPVLDDYGLVAALNWYGRQFGQRTNISITIEGTVLSPRLVPRVENALFRIAQEALVNVSKHAQATGVVVTVQEHGGIVRMVVADDGVGFDPIYGAESDGNQRWGLITMTERAEAEGGRCRIESDANRGTRVVVEIDR